ncbi:hypothetical protein CLD20_09390 [Afifella sp. IM 167]|nr:hypothetical protein [Afifella sp. IM 167]
MGLMANSAAHLALRRVTAISVLVGSAGLLGGCPAATTYGTGEAPEMAIFSEVAGIGGFAKKQEHIEYKPRSPLVMPPENAGLRAPEEGADVRTAQWPGGGETKPVGIRAESPQDRNGRDIARDDLTPEYVASLKPLGALSRGRTGPANTSDRNEVINSKYVTQRDRAAGRDVQKALNESKGIGITERRYLTDPPGKYRQPAPNAPVDPENRTEKKEGNFFTRLFR